jgi:tRNA(Ile)-lysidine synthetase-like protein
VILDFKQPKGVYVVAVSGGVDSVGLLHALQQQFPENTYVVAHVNHGIRDDADEDRALVQELAVNLGLPFEYTELHLGRSVNEADARDARYAYLQSIKNKHNAHAIITAHHQDDVLETLFINLVRGTGRRGISSLKSTQDIVRPILHVRKEDIYVYAHTNDLQWREDSTNSDKTYLRNKIRHDVVAKMEPQHRDEALRIISRTQSINTDIDKEIAILLRRGLHKGTPVLSRRWFIQLPHDIATEVIYVLLRQSGVKDIDKKTVERTVIAIKTMQPGKKIQLSGVDVLVTKRSARFISRGKTDENPV